MSQELTLPSQLAKYLDLFEKMLDSTLLLEVEGFTVIDANPASEKLFGQEVEKLRGQPLIHWIPQKDQDEFTKILRVVRRRYHPKQVQCQFQIRNATLMIQVVLCTLKLSDGSDVLQVIAQDVTEAFEAKQKAEQYLKELAEMNQKLELLSITDEMTKLYNFRYFKERLLQEHERSKRYKSSYSIIFCDLDNFKHYNDRNGHPAGDELLRQLAKVLQGEIRNSDVVSRYGGEEFVVICPETTAEDARILAERIRAKIEGYPFPHASAQPLGKVSISMGISSFPQDGESAQEVLQAADQAVYASKENGRNRVTLSKDVPKQKAPKSKKKLD